MVDLPIPPGRAVVLPEGAVGGGEKNRGGRQHHIVDVDDRKRAAAATGGLVAVSEREFPVKGLIVFFGVCSFR